MIVCRSASSAKILTYRWTMKYIRQSLIWTLIAVLALYTANSSVKAVAGAFAQEAASQELDGYITRSMKDWEGPGLATAIVKDDRVVLAKGYGVRKLGDPAAVDENTLFAIGSCSKAFTAAALAIL